MGVDEAVTDGPWRPRPLALPLAERGQGWGWFHKGRALSDTTPTFSSSPHGGGAGRVFSDDDVAGRRDDETWPTSLLVAGIGFRHGATPDEIVALIRRALAESGHASQRLGTLATAEDRAGEAPVFEAAAAFGLVPTGIPPAGMIAVDDRVPTRSRRIQASRQVGSVAEAAALAAAGAGGTLVLRRISSPSVTCALALPAQFATQAP